MHTQKHGTQHISTDALCPQRRQKWMDRTANRRWEPSERGLCVKVPVESHGCWQRGEEIWLAAGIREHLTGPRAAGRTQTHWSRQRRGHVQGTVAGKVSSIFLKSLLKSIKSNGFWVAWKKAKKLSAEGDRFNQKCCFYAHLFLNSNNPKHCKSSISTTGRQRATIRIWRHTDKIWWGEFYYKDSFTKPHIEA